MEKDAALYNLTQNTQGALFQAATQALTPEERAARQEQSPVLQIRQGYAESTRWVMVQAHEFAPQPLTVERFRRRAVYAAPGLVFALLELLASEDYFDRHSDEYHLTPAGQAFITTLYSHRSQMFQHFALPDVDVHRLEILLRKILDASLQSAILPGTWCLAHSRNRAPSEDDSSLVKIAQYGSDLNAFRDDCHMCAFGIHGISGHQWEAFAFVCDGQAHSAETLFQQLAYRGWTRSEWQTALDDLAGRGWLAAENSHYHATATGMTIRTEVEEQTNRYFYAPWEVLSAAECNEAVQLMQALQDACQRQLAPV